MVEALLDLSLDYYLVNITFKINLKNLSIALICLTSIYIIHRNSRINTFNLC
jgi:hypothetical protein